ncbi:unnamed protein product [Absidia cylindrospora]
MGQYYGCEEQTPLTPVYDNIDLRKEEITPEDKSLHDNIVQGLMKPMSLLILKSPMPMANFLTSDQFS